MRHDQLVALLGRLGLGRASKRTAKALGLSLRQLQRLTCGKSPIPAPVALLAIAYSKHGLPNPLWDPDVSRVDILARTTEQLRAYAPARKAMTKPAPSIVTVTPPDLKAMMTDMRTAKRQREEKAIALRLKRQRR
jgi:hypothetical protein